MYLQKVTRQFALLFTRPYGPLTAGPRGPTIIDRARVLEALLFSEHYLANCPPYVPDRIRDRYAQTLKAARAEFEKPWPSGWRFGLSVRVSLLYEWLRRPFVWMVAVPMFICVAAALWPRWRASIDWRAAAPALSVASWATASAALCALTSSVAQALEIQRYIDLFLPLTLFSQFLWPLIATSMVVAILRNPHKKAKPSVTELADGRANSPFPPHAPR